DKQDRVGIMGENGAGKSTLMKCMFGIYSMDAGEILYEGKVVHIGDPLNALKLGISMVHQELQPITERSVAENIFVGRYPMKKLLGFIPIVDHKKMYSETARVLKEVRMNFDPKQKLGSLSVSQMQSVEIAKAVSNDCKVLI
ncbi:MAG: ATP-binding cassette domain-containing protein, partial [Ruthenibacterium sp.]